MPRTTADLRARAAAWDAAPTPPGDEPLLPGEAPLPDAPGLQGLTQWLHHHSREVRAYWSMARPINIVPSFLLVLLGAWVGGGRQLAALAHPAVWGMGFVSVGIATASCIVNDFFDYAAGLDAAGPGGKPLPNGSVTPGGALLLAAVGYILVLVGGCLLGDSMLRQVVASSACLTLLYTPLLKRLPLVKNAAVAATIAAAPAAGAVAAAGGAAADAVALVRIAPTCAFLFGCFVARELLMDIGDADSDAAAGVRTLPALLGRAPCVLLCAAVLAGCAAVVMHGALLGPGLAWAWGRHGLPAPEAAVRWGAAAAAAANWGAQCLGLADVWCSGFDPRRLAAAVDRQLLSVAVGALILAAVG